MVSGSDYNGFYIDIWATGIILFAMTCGYLPFEDPDNDKLFELILKAKLEFPSHLSEICKDLIKKILVTDPHKRITINKIKEHEFYLMGKGEYNALFNRKKNKLKIKKHNSDNYLNNINVKNINDEYEINYNNNHNEVKTINNTNIKKEKNKTEINTRSNSKDKIKNVKNNNNENSEDTNKVNNYITSNRVGKYKINGFKLPTGLLNNIKSEKTSKGLVTEANIDINRIKDMQINGFNIKNDLISLKRSNKSSERPKIFLKNKINIQKLTQIKKFPLKFNLTELTNNYINTKIFSRIKNAKREKNNINNIALINSMNSKNKPLIIDNALINININSNKYIIGNIGNDNTDFRIRKNKEKNEGIMNKKIKSKTPTVLRFYNYNFPNIKKDEIININKNNDIFSNRLRLKTDYNYFKNNDYLEPNLKTMNNIGHNKDNLKYKLNQKLRFNKIYSFLHKK
jgi:5'-AMP-activated protein kinase catalytic alpha subunit